MFLMFDYNNLCVVMKRVNFSILFFQAQLVKSPYILRMHILGMSLEPRGPFGNIILVTLFKCCGNTRGQKNVIKICYIV